MHSSGAEKDCQNAVRLACIFGYVRFSRVEEVQVKPSSSSLVSNRGSADHALSLYVMVPPVSDGKYSARYQTSFNNLPEIAFSMSERERDMHLSTTVCLDRETLFQELKPETRPE